MSGSFFVCRFCFVIIWWVVRDLLYRRLSWVWETCHTSSLFFWRPVLFCLSFLFCIIWWVWEICHTVEYDGCERPVIPCSSFSYVESLLFFFILCTGLSTFIPSYYLRSRLWIYIYFDATEATETYLLTHMIHLMMKNNLIHVSVISYKINLISAGRSVNFWLNVRYA